MTICNEHRRQGMGDFYAGGEECPHCVRLDTLQDVRREIEAQAGSYGQVIDVRETLDRLAGLEKKAGS